MSRLLIVNRMYAGDYFNQGENIGGEVINLLKTDGGDNYIWLNPHGTCNTDFLTKYDHIYVLLVKKFAPWKWQVVGISEVDISESKKITKNKYGASEHEDQCKIAKNVRYGGQKYSEITKDNISNGKKTYPTALFFTFKSKKTWIPVVENSKDLEKTIFSVSRDNKPVGNDDTENSKSIYKKGLTPRQLCMYIHDEEGLKIFRGKEKDFDINKDEYLSTYNYLNAIVENCLNPKNESFEIKWKELPDDEKVNKYKDSLSKNIFDEYFLDVIGDADRELSFSNLLAYFLKNKEILELFVEKFLGVTDFDCTSATIHREESNIDLLISSASHQIIIENKIKSDLILKKKGMKKFLNDYFSCSSKAQKDAQEKLRDKFFSNNQEREHYQIDRYFAYAVSKAITYGAENYSDAYNKVQGFIVAPNYNYTVVEAERENAIFKEKFKTKTYNDLYKFFKEYENQNIKYLDEFLKAMHKHTKQIDNSIEEKTLYYFYRKIKEIESQKTNNS